MTSKHPRLCDCGNVIDGGSHDLNKGSTCESCKPAQAGRKGIEDAYTLMKESTKQSLVEGFGLLGDDDPADCEDN